MVASELDGQPVPRLAGAGADGFRRFAPERARFISRSPRRACLGARFAGRCAGRCLARPPENAAAITERLGAIDELVAGALAEGKLPGCVIVVGQHDRVLFHKAYGQRALMPDPLAMTEDTVFDLASLTKPIATATAVMILVERSSVDLDEHIDRLRARMRSASARAG